jgi:hypothetical protein
MLTATISAPRPAAPVGSRGGGWKHRRNDVYVAAYGPGWKDGPGYFFPNANVYLCPDGNGWKACPGAQMW